jgi:hypothetical protein
MTHGWRCLLQLNIGQLSGFETAVASMRQSAPLKWRPDQGGIAPP